MILRIAFTLLVAAIFASCGKASSVAAPQTAGVVDLSLVRDGVWEGSDRNITVAVTVTNHRIVQIDYLKHGWTTVGRKAQYIRDDIIERQSLQVDVVSGATITSKNILKAVETALMKGTE